MIDSIRHIGVTLFVFGVLSLTLQTAHVALSMCTENGADCVATALIGYDFSAYETPLATAESTVQNRADYPSMTGQVLGVMGAIGQLALVVAVIVLIGLELVQLHYLRQLFGKRLKLRS